MKEADMKPKKAGARIRRHFLAQEQSAGSKT